jgi:hypothetical protein
MPWPRRLLSVYHGTVGPYADDIRDNGIQLAKCSLESDFDRGFYTTRILGQAIEFANERFRQMTKDHARHPSVYPDAACGSVGIFYRSRCPWQFGNFGFCPADR